MDVALRFEVQAVLGSRVGDAPLELVDARTAGQAQCDVFRNGQGVEQGKMLEHHADAHLPRHGRACNGYGLTIPGDGPGIRADHAIDDFHQRGLAGPVLAEYGVDLPGLHDQTHPVVRHNGRVLFGDVVQREASQTDCRLFRLAAILTAASRDNKDVMAETASIIWNTLIQEFSDIPDAAEATRLVTRLAMAILLGAAIGYERELKGKSAGLRTHMLVSLGAAIFVLVPLQSGIEAADMSRVIQGVI